MNTKKLTLSILFIFSLSFLYAQRYTISGYVKSAITGETLIGANVYNTANPVEGTTSNAYGFYSLTLPEGAYQLTYSYLGYTDQVVDIQLVANEKRTIELSEGVTIEAVVVTAEESDKNVESTKMGVVQLPVENIKKLPALMGEVDILKTLQLLPGVLSAGEGNSGFYVRGGGPDQNLILLDEAVVYNSGHLLGFFSVFNADALKNTTLIKGGMPGNYGGRLSSVVDVQMKDGNNQKFALEGGVGLIASRLTVQGPLVKNKSSFIISGRRTYAFELAQPFIDKSNLAGTSYYFYDLNAKINYQFSDRDRLYLSTYFGRDVLNYNSNERDLGINLPYGNATATLRWNHLFSDQLFMNISAIYNDYDFSFGGRQGDFQFNLISGVRDYNGKVDFDYYPGSRHHIKFGANYTYHKLTPNVANATDGTTEFSNNFKPQYAHESAIYLQDDFKVNVKLSINVGLRGSSFTQLGPYVSTFDQQVYEEGKPVKTYYGIEPRVSGKYSLSATTSIKAGVALTNQYLHLVSNSTSTLPADVWVPSSELIKPQIGIQYALGYFRNFSNDAYETSVEVYYKNLYNQIDYRENYVNNPAVGLENEFVFGEGRSYGLELFLKKRTGALNGWIGYTLSRTERQFPDINNGDVFPSVYDRTHDLSVVGNYQLSKKWEFGGAFVFGTGNAFTPIRALYLIDQRLSPDYGLRNSGRIQSYHRFDLSATFTPKPEVKNNFSSNWTFSVYNVYNRRNPFFIYYGLEANVEAGTASAKGYKVSLFPVIPSVTWNFKWKQK